MKTVLITGCSSGFGLAIAQHFLDNGWKVIATMRRVNPNLLPQSENLKLIELDVTQTESIHQAVELAGDVDVLVNNAGVGWLSVLESAPDRVIRNIFDTNTFGCFEMIRAVLPGMRANGVGTIINVSSSVTIKPLPLLAAYTASKAALNAFSECLALELKPLGINVHLVLPGQSPGTDFSKNAIAAMDQSSQTPAEYEPFIEEVMSKFTSTSPEDLTQSQDVVEAVWRAATDIESPFKLVAGKDAIRAQQEVCAG
ncbi:SDR family oxidoreductase [Agarivorans sp. Toyoura001]|uniref:SDR family oxidoreductase n=1 Tax=unclassified Agarivorans TaxID=2636026 RepID=UPI0010D53982|nr:SDR family oxidoreductase [Agarivorans sp. Toyoura001]GDY25424.1 short-chain dehydrogenase/reductase [Agarivorans sp. Toyoura001]